MFAARMAYCGPRGIPLSTFLAWPQPDQDAALEWTGHEARRCRGCGTHPDDWNPNAGGSRTHGHFHERVCPGCQLRQRAESAQQPDGTRGVHLVFAAGGPGACQQCAPPKRT